jgi:hypothetical protein
LTTGEILRGLFDNNMLVSHPNRVENMNGYNE